MEELATLKDWLEIQKKGIQTAIDRIDYMLTKSPDDRTLLEGKAFWKGRLSGTKLTLIQINVMIENYNAF